MAVSDRDAFLSKYRAAAEQVAKETGIPVERILAQAGHETGWNVNAPGNNFFGIKAQPGYDGKHQMLPTQEDYGNGLQNVRQRFRVYDDPADSFRDWAKLMQQDNFKPALQPGLPDAEYAQTLKDGGYATDPDYAKKLTATIASTRQAMNGGPDVQTALNTPLPNQTINGAGAGAGADPALASATTAQPAGGTPPAQAVAGAKSLSLGDPVRNGLALMAAGAPSSQMPTPPQAPIHKPEQLASLLDMIFPQRRNQLFG